VVAGTSKPRVFGARPVSITNMLQSRPRHVCPSSGNCARVPPPFPRGAVDGGKAEEYATGPRVEGVPSTGGNYRQRYLPPTVLADELDLLFKRELMERDERCLQDFRALRCIRLAPPRQEANSGPARLPLDPDRRPGSDRQGRVLQHEDA